MSLRPLLKGGGGGVVCSGMAELSDRCGMRFGMQSGFGDESG